VTSLARAERDSLVIARGPRIRIRRKVREDGPDEYRWRADPEVTKYDAGTASPLTLALFLSQFQRSLQYGEPNREQFALEAEDGCHIGSIMYYHADSAGESAEIGLTIAEAEYRGRGLGREAVIAFLRYLWSAHPFRRIYLHTLEWNERARQCFGACGFDATGQVERDGHSLIRMETRREWWLLWEMEGRFGRVPEDAASSL
jgi:RimJ/RimL family protein N-acetyltransferase